MKGIYSNASKVVVWLGDADETSDSAMDLVCALADSLPVLREVDPGRRVRESCFGRSGVPKETDPRWEYLGNLFDRPWFSRVWVLQKVSFARAAVAHCGKKQIPWEKFATMNDEIADAQFLKVHISMYGAYT